MINGITACDVCVGDVYNDEMANKVRENTEWEDEIIAENTTLKANCERYEEALIKVQTKWEICSKWYRYIKQALDNEQENTK